MRSLTALLLLGLSGCGGTPKQQVIPEFPLKAMRSPHARGVKLYVSPQGMVDKVAVAVAREALPDWTFALADAQLGAGTDIEFEIEQYANGDEIYEITRLVEGKPKEIAIRGTDRKVVYFEDKGLDVGDLPEAVRTALDTPPGGLEVMGIQHQRRADGTDRYTIKGRRQGVPVSVTFSAKGQKLSERHVLPGDLALDR
ncbi:MAG: hypothetical protein ACE366_12185 [Bradymonadia bacterium]